MYLRLAGAQDLPKIANVAAQAMFDDELFDLICPKRHEYYSDYREGFMRRVQDKLALPGWVVVVAEDAGLVVGYSVWERIGDTGSAKRWKEGKDGLRNRTKHSFLKFSNQLAAKAHPDRSVDDSRLAQYNAIHCFPFENYPEIWCLSAVAVDPDHQCQGIGKTLIEWGIEQASQDNVPVCLEASAKGIGLYEKLGFKVVNELEWEGITIMAMMWEKPITKPDIEQVLSAPPGPSIESFHSSTSHLSAGMQSL